MTHEEILALPMKDNDAGAATVGDYMRQLLKAIWREGESFSGKRPFGNSGWEFEVYAALIEGGALPGTLDEYGYVSEVDTEAALVLVLGAIDALFGEPAE